MLRKRTVLVHLTIAMPLPQELQQTSNERHELERCKNSSMRCSVHYSLECILLKSIQHQCLCNLLCTQCSTHSTDARLLDSNCKRMFTTGYGVIIRRKPPLCRGLSA